MKGFLFFVVIMVIGYVAWDRSSQREREQLVGVWQMNRNVEGADLKMTMEIKPGGPVTLGVIASRQGGSTSKAMTGTWTCMGSKFYMQFDNAAIPGHGPNDKFGGYIQTLNDKTLSYRAVSGVETWVKVR